MYPFDLYFAQSITDRTDMLINCVAYQNGVKLADITVEEISDYLEKKDCFVWVALRDTAEAELEKMQEEFGLHDLAVEDARHGHQRPKIEEYGDEIFAVLQTMQFAAVSYTHLRAH